MAYMAFTNCGPVPGAAKVTDAIYYTVHSFDVSSQVNGWKKLSHDRLTAAAGSE